MATSIESIIQTLLDNWYVFLIMGLGLGFVWYFLKAQEKKTWYVNFKAVFKKERMKDEELNRAVHVKYITRGDKRIGKVLRYSEINVPIEKKVYSFATAVFFCKNTLGFWHDKQLLRFVKSNGNPVINLLKRSIEFAHNTTFIEKDGFFMPLSGDSKEIEFAFNTITEDIQKWDKDRTLDVNASSMQKLASLPPEWAHEEKMQEKQLEIMDKFRKGIGWKAG